MARKSSPKRNSEVSSSVASESDIIMVEIIHQILSASPSEPENLSFGATSSLNLSLLLLVLRLGFYFWGLYRNDEIHAMMRAKLKLFCCFIVLLVLLVTTGW